jgi:hypothetical protein
MGRFFSTTVFLLDFMAAKSSEAKSHMLALDRLK